MLNRRGFTLAEMVVAAGVLGVLGLAMTRLLLSEGRFTDLQNAARGARAVARQSMNVLVSELRMVPDSGFIDSASTDGKTIRVMVPYRYGITCGTNIISTIASFLPVDSLQYAQARYYGYAYRQDDGTYVKKLLSDVGGSSPSTSTSSRCTNNGIRPDTVAGRTGVQLGLRPLGTADTGRVVFLFQRVRYSFKASSAFTGKVGLWRYVDGGADEELVAPFDTSARFKYWAAGASSAVSAPPALDQIRGVDVVLAGTSTFTPQGRTAPAKATLITSIFFKNVSAF